MAILSHTPVFAKRGRLWLTPSDPLFIVLKYSDFNQQFTGCFAETAEHPVGPSGESVDAEPTDFYWLALGILAVWRVTHFVSKEDGPWDASVRLRRLAGMGFWGRLLDCFYCVSLWVSAPFALFIGENARHAALLWLALSAGASLLERLTEPSREAPPAVWMEHQEVSHDLLRETQSGMAQRGPDGQDR